MLCLVPELGTVCQGWPTSGPKAPDNLALRIIGRFKPLHHWNMTNTVVLMVVVFLNKIPIMCKQWKQKKHALKNCTILGKWILKSDLNTVDSPTYFML